MGTLTSSLIVRLVDQVSRPARGVSNSLLGIQRAGEGANRVPFGQRLAQGIQRNNAALANARGGLVDAAAGFYALRTAIAAPVRAAMEFESVMADVAKVVDFPTPEAFDQFKADLIALSKQVPLSVQQLGELAAAAGESFDADEILEVVTAASKIGVAFGISAADAGAALPELMNAMGLTLDEAVLLADGINQLSNNMASSAPKVLDFMRSVGADSGQYGFAAEEAAAFGSAMLASGYDASVAGTSFRNMGRSLTRGASATGRQSDALKALGMDSVQIANDMQRDAVGTTMRVIEAIGRMPEAQRAALSSDLFGNEARALGPLIANTDLLREALGLVGEQGDYAGSAFKEFEVRAGTFENAVQLFNNRMTALKVVIGAALIPTINRLMESIVPVVEKFSEFATANPELVSNIMAAAGSLVALRVAASALKFAGLLGRGGALSLLSFGLNTVGRASMRLWGAAAANVAYTSSLSAMAGAGKLTALGKLGAAVRGMAFAVPGVAMLSTVFGWLGAAAAAVGTAIAGITAPVWGAIALAVAAVAAAGYSLWKWWDRIAGTLAGVARRIGEELKPALGALQPVLEAIRPVTDAVGVAFSAMGDAIGSVLDWFKTKWEEFKGWIGGFFQREVLTEAETAAVEQRGYDMADRVINAIKNVFSGLIGVGRMAITKLLWGMRARGQALMDWVGEIPGKITDGLATLATLMPEKGRAVIADLWAGMRESFTGFIAWVQGIPGRIIEAIGSIDLSSIINWPEPPKWWTDLFGGGEPQQLAAPEMTTMQYPGFGDLSYENKVAAGSLENAGYSGGLPTPARLQELSGYAEHLKTQIAAIQGEMDALIDSPMKPAIVAPMQSEMRQLQEELSATQSELSTAEQEAIDLSAALAIVSDTDATPEISTASIDAALQKVRLLASGLNNLPGATSAVNGPSIDGQRAGGGDVKRGGTYLVGEEGPELVTFGQKGFVHTARQTMRAMSGAASRFGGGGGSAVPGGFPDLGALVQQGAAAIASTATGAFSGRSASSEGVTLKIESPLIGSVSIASGQNPLDVVDQIGDALEARLARMMRGLHSDGMA